MSQLQPILAVASLAFRESARNRVLHALIFALAAACGISFVFAWAAGGDSDPARQVKIVGDVSFSALALLGTIASIFLGTNLVYQEIERRTVFSVLARPISRAGFVVGKYLGLAAVMGLALALMSGMFLVVFALAGGTIGLHVLVALLLTYVELLVVIAIALFFSVAAHPIEGAVFSFLVALAGHQTSSLNDLAAEILRQAGPEPGLLPRLMQKVLYGLYVLIPNLENFNLRGSAVYGLDFSWSFVAGALAYAAVYVVVVLAVSSLVFRRRVL